LTYPGEEPEREILNANGITATLTKPVRFRRLINCLRVAIHGEAPEAEAAPGDAAEPGEGAAEGSARTLRILLAEDNVVNRKVALQQLHKLGYTADTADTGREVLEALGRKSYDVILMDCQMPELDGFETTREIRQREAAAGKGEHAYIVAMTANALAGDREQCIGAGMDDYVDKPVQLARLRAAVVRGLQHTRAQQLPAPAKPDDDTPVDFKVLTDLLGPPEPGQPNPLVDLIDLFLNDTPSQVERMQSALPAGDRAALRLAAHSLKGSATNLGARKLAGLCLEIETQAKAEGGALDSNLLNLLTTEFQRVKTALEAEKDRLMSKN
ncbi:MAG TPA: response regulator, partial [Verrucomicrobiae bacterium]